MVLETVRTLNAVTSVHPSRPFKIEFIALDTQGAPDVGAVKAFQMLTGSIPQLYEQVRATLM